MLGSDCEDSTYRGLKALKMGLSGDGEDDIFKRHQDLCVNLNMDRDAADEAWRNYEAIRQNYFLEVSGRNFEVGERRRCDYFVVCDKFHYLFLG
jgi:hypothetical protein